MSNTKPMNESDIASDAALVLRENFITVARSETVLYVEADALMSKPPNGEPVLIKRLSGRNPDLAKKFFNRGTYKIKKRKVEAE